MADSIGDEMRVTVDAMPEPKSLRNADVVLIDDDPDALEIAVLAIERAGLHARPVRDAAKARQSIRKSVELHELAGLVGALISAPKTVTHR